MKTLFGLTAITSLAIVAAVSTLNSAVYADGIDSILEPSSTLTLRPAIIQQDAPPASVLDAPQVEVLPTPLLDPQPTIQVPFAPADRLIVDEQYHLRPQIHGPVANPPVVVHSHRCTTCKHVQCRCRRPAKVATVFCLVDPSGCEHHACINVPACCAGEQPSVSWKGRLFGRQVATLCWACCDKEVKVVVTRRGKVKVRD